MRDDPRWDSDERYTFVVVGSRRPLSAVKVRVASLREGRGLSVTRVMEPWPMEEWLRNGDGVLLTDDFVPVDGMLAPLYLDSRLRPLQLPAGPRRDLRLSGGGFSDTVATWLHAGSRS
jgi:hypothetical protein